MFKKDWSGIDRRVALFSDEDAESYEKLVRYLEAPLKNDPDRDLYITRGLLIWLYYNIKHRTGSIAVDSPLKLASELSKSSSVKHYADVFTKLCKKAKIQCETVEGVAKNDTFEPGNFQVSQSSKLKMKSYWNKVCLQGVWRPVHTYWCLKPNVSESAKTGKRKAMINEFWFLTEPGVFIINFFPDNLNDQLLPKSLSLQRYRQFMKLAYLTPAFFDYGLTLTSENSCVIDTINGKAELSFKTHKANSKLICSYSLKNEQGSDVSTVIFMSRKKRRFTFEMRCPEVGSYRLVICGQYPNEQDANILLKVKIICRERMPDYRPLPIDVGEVGWGFGPDAYKNGLYDPQVKTPKIVVPRKVSGKEVIKFKIQKEAVNDTIYKAELYSKNKSSPLEGCVTAVKDSSTCELRISMALPSEDEFALVIEARDKHMSFEPICNYLITAVEDKEKVEEYYYDSSDGTTDQDEEIDTLEVERMKLQAQTDRLRRFANRRHKSTATECAVDVKPVKMLAAEADDSPLVVYMLELFLAVLAVCAAVLKVLTFGIIDRL